MLAAMDEAVGQIVAAVDQAGARRNTLFIFSSDNGGLQPGVVSDTRNAREAAVARRKSWDGSFLADPERAARSPKHTSIAGR